MHGLLLNTYKDLIEVLKIHTSFLPDDDLIDNDVIDLPLKENRPASHKIQVCNIMLIKSSQDQDDYFSDAVLAGGFAYFAIFRYRNGSNRGDFPFCTKNDTKYVGGELVCYQTSALGSLFPLFHEVQMLLLFIDTIHETVLRNYKIFIHSRPMINHKIEDRICGYPPEIEEVLKQDPITQVYKNELQEILEKNLNAVRRYCQRFDVIKEFYYEDVTFNEDIIRDNRDCKLFREWSVRYKQELDLIKKVIDSQPFGLFFIQLERFKNAAETAPRGKIGVIEAVMPG